MNPPSSRIAALAAVAAAALLAACASSPSKGLEQSMRGTVQDGMPVGSALLALQTRGFTCASGLGEDRHIECARNVANLTHTCVERVSFQALSKQDAVAGFAVAEPHCAWGVPDEARNVPQVADHIA